MSELQITVSEVVETEFGEKVQLETPYKAKQYIKYMPWSKDDTVNSEELNAETIAPDYEFSPNFGCHHSWNPDDYVWEIDRESIHQAVDYFESIGIEVNDETGLLLHA